MGEGAVPAGVRAIWAKVLPKVEANPIAQASAMAVSANPEDQDSIEMLKLALKKVLVEIEKSEPDLLAELKKLMDGDLESIASGNSANVTAGTILQFGGGRSGDGDADDRGSAGDVSIEMRSIVA